MDSPVQSSAQSRVLEIAFLPSALQWAWGLPLRLGVAFANSLKLLPKFEDFSSQNNVKIVFLVMVVVMVVVGVLMMMMVVVVVVW